MPRPLTDPAAPPPADPSPLPPGWRWARLRDIADLVGDAVDPQTAPQELYAHYSIPAFDAGKQATLEHGQAIRSTKLLFPRNAVLFSKLNPRINRVWHVDDHHELRRICSTEFLPLVPRASLLDAPFLTFALQQPSLVAYLRSRVAAATKSRERLNPDSVLDVHLPLPPIAEQRRIAALLTEQMTAVDRARAAAEAQLAAADALPAAYLRAVFDGEEAQAWPLKPIGSLANTCSGTTPPRQNPSYYLGNIPWVKTGELRDGWINDTEEHVSEAAMNGTSLRLLPPGTLLVAMYGQGQTRGRTGLLTSAPFLKGGLDYAAAGRHRDRG